MDAVSLTSEGAEVVSWLQCSGKPTQRLQNVRGHSEDKWQMSIVRQEQSRMRMEKGLHVARGGAMQVGLRSHREDEAQRRESLGKRW